jgi:ribosomal protein L19
MYSRRQFLICAGVALLPTGLQGLAKLHPAADTGMGFHAVELDTLAAITDEIIPAGEGMPAASVAGGPQYLQYLGWQYPAIQREIGDFLRTVTQTSSDIFRQDFRKLSSGQHVRILTSIEESKKSAFSAFTGYVYESYYTNPTIVGPISCLRSRSVEDVEPLLAPVLKLKHVYREVP